MAFTGAGCARLSVSVRDVAVYDDGRIERCDGRRQPESVLCQLF